WATQTEAANANANALRWGTTYNFRFDADFAPVGGTATLGLWRSGSPPAVGISVEVPGGATSIAFCFGDGSGTACPCGNNGAAGNVRTYQCWYRNAAAFCTVETFNLSNGRQVTWAL